MIEDSEDVATMLLSNILPRAYPDVIERTPDAVASKPGG